jgi:hypothetical protein
MFDQSSRYYVLETVYYRGPDGRQIAYKRRRFLPAPASLPLLEAATVQPGDRLDLIAARSLGDPLQFWQICDANDCLNPFDLAGEGATGSQLRVPVPQFQVPG